MVKLISITDDAERIIAYCARVSSPLQANPDYEKLLSYCIRHKHWSVFQMASMTIEVETSRAISAQMLRHASMSFQEFSQRYAPVNNYVEYEARRQDDKNRQASHDDLGEDVKQWWRTTQQTVWNTATALYNQALARGIAKECARMILPMNTASRLYMNGTIRSFIHYIQARDADGVQPEHRAIAQDAKSIFCTQLPTIARALGWISPSTSRTGDSNVSS